MPLDGSDPDLVDAARLAMSDGMGGTLWRPARLQDIYDTPDRVLTLWEFYRLGQMAREHPFDWWRPQGSREFAHLYPASFSGVPEDPARCTVQPAEDIEWERTGGMYACRTCKALSEDTGRASTGDPTHPSDPARIRLVAGME